MLGSALRLLDDRSLVAELSVRVTGEVVVEVLVVCACESVGRETRELKSTFPCLQWKNGWKAPRDGGGKDWWN